MPAAGPVAEIWRAIQPPSRVVSVHGIPKRQLPDGLDSRERFNRVELSGPARLGPACGERIGRVLRPGVLWVSPAQILPEVDIAAAPKGLDVPRQRNRSLGRREEFDGQRRPSIRDRRVRGRSEHLLNLAGSAGAALGPVVDVCAAAGPGSPSWPARADPGRGARASPAMSGQRLRVRQLRSATAG